MNTENFDFFRKNVLINSFYLANNRINKFKNKYTINDNKQLSLKYIDYIKKNYNLVKFNIKKDILIISTQNEKTLVYKIFDNEIKFLSFINNFNNYSKNFNFHPLFPLSNKQMPSLVSGNLDGSVLLWTLNFDLENQNYIQINKHNGYCNDSKFHLLGNYVLSCGNDKIIKLTDIDNIKNIHDFKGHLNEIIQIENHPDSNLLFSNDNCGNIAIWDLRISKVISNINSDSFINDLIINENGYDLYFTNNNNAIYNYDIRKQYIYKEILNNKKKVKKLNLLDNNKYLCSISLDNTIKLYNLNTFNKINEFTFNESFITSDVYNDNNLIIGTSENKMIFSQIVNE